MADSSFSATELRNRYHRGGSVPDSDLTAVSLFLLLFTVGMALPN